MCAPMVRGEFSRDHGECLDARLFRTIPYHNSASASREERGEDHMTRRGSWLKRWKHCSQSGILSLRASSSLTDMPFVRTYEDDKY